MYPIQLLLLRLSYVYIGTNAIVPSVNVATNTDGLRSRANTFSYRALEENGRDDGAYKNLLFLYHDDDDDDDDDDKNDIRKRLFNIPLRHNPIRIALYDLYDIRCA